jgi:hypothetical protein
LIQTNRPALAFILAFGVRDTELFEAVAFRICLLTLDDIAQAFVLAVNARGRGLRWSRSEHGARQRHQDGKQTFYHSDFLDRLPGL